MFGGFHRPEGWQPVAAFNTSDHEEYFAQTGHGVYGAFYRRWQATGGLAWWGYPISEPYWVWRPDAAGPVPVLVQLFERRSLTFTPSNPVPWRVEQGNVGIQYKTWRYGP